jgi:hypothetical protein
MIVARKSQIRCISGHDHETHPGLAAITPARRRGARTRRFPRAPAGIMDPGIQGPGPEANGRSHFPGAYALPGARILPGNLAPPAAGRGGARACPVNLSIVPLAT